MGGLGNPTLQNKFASQWTLASDPTTHAAFAMALVRFMNVDARISRKGIVIAKEMSLMHWAYAVAPVQMTKTKMERAMTQRSMVAWMNRHAITLLLQPGPKDVSIVHVASR